MSIETASTSRWWGFMNQKHLHNTQEISHQAETLFSSLNSLTSGGWRPSWSHLQEASPPAQQAAVSTNTAGREFPFHLHVWLPLSWFSFDPLRAWKTHDDHQHSSSTTQENLITTGFSAVGPWSLSVHSLYFQSIFLLFYGVFALLLSWLNVLIFYSISKLL